MTVKPYSLVSYSSVVQKDLSFDVWDLSAEHTDNMMRIYATVKVPENATTVNQVWQVGSAVSSGAPQKHAFQTANLNSKGTLDLTGGQSTSGSSGDSRVKKRNVGFYMFLLLLGIISVLCF